MMLLVTCHRRTGILLVELVIAFTLMLSSFVLLFSSILVVFCEELISVVEDEDDGTSS